MLQSPYVVGRWVRGVEHYDRQGLIEYLLTSQDTAIWLVGTRRMGKTSLLRQIELVAHAVDSRLVPLFWDLQGCNSPTALTFELLLAIEDAAEQLSDLELDVASLRHEDAVGMLRRMSRALVRQDRQLLLLIDEAEVLVEVAQSDPSWLARLRKAMQEGHLRAIIASTRLLTQLTDQSAGWVTSPFLFGFRLVTLWPLKREGAVALIRQSQGDLLVAVESAVLDEILRCTNHHPYLVQYLCEQLFVPDETGGGHLRAPTDKDLQVDAILAGLFALDYQRLSEIERRLLIAAVEVDVAAPDVLIRAAGPAQASRLPALLRDLEELGHLRQVEGGWAVGSEFLRRLLRLHLDEFRAELETLAQPEAPLRLDESNIESVAQTLGISSDRLRSFAETQIRSETALFDVICGFFYEIRHLVEQDEGYRLLVTHQADGALGLRSEEEIQIALMHWLRPMCRALNIDMNRESLTGRGLLDFKFSVGHDFRCLAEVKLFSSAKLADGLGTQLPIYLISDKSRYGIYVPIFLESADYDGRIATLQELAARRDRSHGVTLEVIGIRAWRPKSASKADAPDAPERYAMDPRPSRMAARLQARHQDGGPASDPSAETPRS